MFLILHSRNKKKERQIILPKILFDIFDSNDVFEFGFINFNKKIFVFVLINQCIFLNIVNKLKTLFDNIAINFENKNFIYL